MKIKKGFVMREVMGQNVVVAIGEASKKFRGMVKMNKTAAEVWKGVEEGLSEEEIAALFVKKYADVQMENALADVKKVVAKLTDAGIME